MKKKKVIFIIVCMMTIILLGSCKQSEQQEMIYLRLAETMSEKHPASMGASYFAQLVRERSNGRIKMEICYEDMGDANEILEQLEYGGISFARVNSLDVIEKVNSLENDFRDNAFDQPEVIMRWTETEKKKIDEEFHNNGMVPLVWYYPELRCFYNADKIISTVDDFKNLKIKTCNTDLLKKTMNALKATSVSVDHNDVYRSIQNGYMDAGEASFSELVLSDYYDLINHITICKYIAAPDIIVASSKVMEKLTPEDRELILQCAKDTYYYEKEQVEQFQEEYLFRIATNKSVFFETDDFTAQLQQRIKKNEYN